LFLDPCQKGRIGCGGSLTSNFWVGLIQELLVAESSATAMNMVNNLKKLKRSRRQIQILQPSILLTSIHSAVARDRSFHTRNSRENFGCKTQRFTGSSCEKFRQ